MTAGRHLERLVTILVCIFLILCIWGSPEIGRAGEADVSHQTHLSADRGPALGNSCDACHTSEYPAEEDVDYGFCVPCHSPGGSYDGLDDPEIGAASNWGEVESEIYDYDDRLKVEKRKWCVGCHDDGSCVINGVTAPNIAGRSMSGNWESPLAIVEDLTDIPEAGKLIDNNLETGTGGGSVVFDSGASRDLSHIRLYTWGDATVQWEIYGGNDLENWTRILYGQSLIWAAPTWLTGPGNWWDEIRLDRFIPVQYVKLSKKSPWPIPGDALREFQFKKDLQYGYFANGHKVSCDNCHDTTGVHIDGTAQTYRANLDNYQTGFRLIDVDVDGEVVPALEVPRVGCNWGEEPRISNDFALCFVCHDKYRLLGDAYGSNGFFQNPLQTNFRSDNQLDENGNVTNEHLRHLRGRGYCGNTPDWDSDGDNAGDSPISCTACHSVHGSPTPAMTRHGELTSTPDTTDKVPMINLQYFNEQGELDRDLANVLESIGGRTQFYGAGAGTISKNKTCNMCHNDQIAYYRSPIPTCQSCHSAGDPSFSSHYTHLYSDRGPLVDCVSCHASGGDYPHGIGELFADGKLLMETGVCDACHSPSGAFDGVNDFDIGAKTNWANGVYESDGTTLKSGKEQWCAGCHDNEPASSRQGPNFEIVVDNPDAVFECTWGTSSTGGYNGDYRWHAAGNGSCTATWTPDLPEADTYNVHARWKANSNRATDAKYTIYYDGGSETVEVNQQINGDQWNLLGTYPFTASTSGYVVLSDDANGYVIADAVKFDNGSLDVSVSAPNVIGDNSTYGFYISGHKIECLSCHDAGKEHIDHEHRTYEVNDSTGVAINPYADSYRLQVQSTKPSRSLCFSCHNSTEVLGQNSSDVSHTNFWNNDSNIENAHWLHAIAFTGIHFDSDWDVTVDSTESCIACHNVHGTPTERMIRHGELISTYGTMDKVPALNFSYLGAATLVGSTGGSMNLAGGSVSQNGVCWACHGAISYYRTPFLGPRVIMGQGDPEEVANDGSGTSTISVFVSDPDGDVSTVQIDLTPIGGSANQAMTDNLDGTYSYLVTIPASTPDSPLTFEITATDALANAGKGAVTLIIVDPNGIYVDNADAQFICDWGISSTGGYKGHYRWHAAGTGSCTATWTPDVPSAETYNVYAWWKASSNRATNAKYTIYHETGSQTIEVNQEIGDSQWNYLGNFSFAAGTSGYVVLSDDANEFVIADAIKLTPSPPPPPETVIVDNPDAQFVCTWGTSSGGYDGDYRWHAAGDGSCTATWTPNLTAGASYSVYAWWVASPNRATDAPYTIYYDGGSQTVDVNQEINGDQWHLLGTFPFAEGQSGYVVLSDDGNEYVVADAIKFEP